MGRAPRGQVPTRVLFYCLGLGAEGRPSPMRSLREEAPNVGKPMPPPGCTTLA